MSLVCRQPVVRELKLVGLPSPEQLPHFLGLVDAREQTLGDRPFPSVEALEHNSRLLHGNLMQLVAAELLDRRPVEQPVLAQVAEHLAVALGAATLLR